MLIPGEGVATLEFTVTLDNTTAQLLNSGREVLEDILILRLEGGRDYYITIKARYARSCFGMSVDELVMYRDPIRSIPLDPIERAEKIDVNSSTALCVPKELWRLVDAINEKGLTHVDLMLEPGNKDEVDQIRESLDTGAPFGVFQVHSYAEALISFLTCLSSPIIPVTLFPSLEVDSTNIQACARRLLEELPPIHYNVFVYVISFFRELLLYKEQNKVTAAKLSRLCCTCLVGPEGASVASQKRTGLQLILLHLLETSSI
jgi:inositol polyphosphate 5-phosphatase INPP5B/F